MQCPICHQIETSHILINSNDSHTSQKICPSYTISPISEGENENEPYDLSVNKLISSTLSINTDTSSVSDVDINPFSIMTPITHTPIWFRSEYGSAGSTYNNHSSWVPQFAGDTRG